MQFYCMKTNMEMFDVCRAYGLGLILDTLKGKEEENVIISDLGIYYLIEGPSIKNYDKKRIIPLFDVNSPSLNWKETFLTSPQRKIKGELKSATRKKIIQAREIISKRIKTILKSYSKPQPIEIPVSKGETLLQSMELVATKGYRVAVRNKVSYTEGAPLKVPKEEWALAILGETHLSVWKLGEGLVFIIPQPQRINIMHWRDIRDNIDVRRLSRVSSSATLSHTAVLLAQELQRRKQSGTPFIDRFSSLIFGGMSSVGRGQWKPNKGGLFPLDFLYDLIESDLEISGEIFEIWDNVFQIGNIRGNEDLALSLSEFIVHPTLESWERYQRVHVRYLLKKDVPIKAYPEECIKEVMKNVRG